MRSRVDSYDWLVSRVIMPIGYVVVGPLAARIGSPTTLVGAGTVPGLLVLLVLLVPAIRAIRQHENGMTSG